MFPEVAERAAVAVGARLAAGEYDALDEVTLTDLLTGHLDAVCDDKHLRVELGGGPLRDAGSLAGHRKGPDRTVAGIGRRKGAPDAARQIRPGMSNPVEDRYQVEENHTDMAGKLPSGYELPRDFAGSPESGAFRRTGGAHPTAASRSAAPCR